MLSHADKRFVATPRTGGRAVLRYKVRIPLTSRATIGVALLSASIYSMTGLFSEADLAKHLGIRRGIFNNTRCVSNPRGVVHQDLH